MYCYPGKQDILIFRSYIFCFAMAGDKAADYAGEAKASSRRLRTLQQPSYDQLALMSEKRHEMKLKSTSFFSSLKDRPCPLCAAKKLRKIFPGNKARGAGGGDEPEMVWQSV